jgi:hypothetical protein
MGVMSFYHNRPGSFTDEVVTDCSSYADHAAVALKTAHAEDRGTSWRLRSTQIARSGLRSA